MVNRFYFKSASEWRNWLKKNHNKANEIWLIYYKKGAAKPTMEYGESVDEALCYGWIDSLIKKIDDEKYARKFHPRKETSFWSELNKKRAVKLIKEKRMTSIGLAKVEAAKKNGMWKKSDPKPDFEIKLTDDFKNALNKNKTAKINFDNFSPSHKKPYFIWISSAKRKKTQLKRIAEAIQLLEKGKKLGLK